MCDGSGGALRFFPKADLWRHHSATASWPAGLLVKLFSIWREICYGFGTVKPATPSRFPRFPAKAATGSMK